MPLVRTVGRLIVAGLVVVACKGDVSTPTDTTPKGSTPTGPVDEDLVQALEALGVDLSYTDRIDPDGNALPADYRPLGAQQELGRADELLFVGVTPTSLASPIGVVEYDGVQKTTLFEASGVEAWVEEEASRQGFRQTLRGAVGADLDGDGLEEVAVVYVDAADASRDREVRLLRYDDDERDYAMTEQLLGLQAGVRDVAVASADLDGDGFDGLVVGLSIASASLVWFVPNTGGVLALDEASVVVLDPLPATDVHGLRIATGNVDYDPGAEVVVVMNEATGSTGGRSRYFVYDDASADHGLLDDGSLTVFDGITYTAVVADAALGDVDGDDLDEIVLAGLGAYSQNECAAQSYLGGILDDRSRGFAQIGSYHDDVFLQDCEDFSPIRLRFVYANTLDIDGDRVDEIAIQNVVFESLDDDAPFGEPVARVPESWFAGETGLYLDLGTFGIVAGNFDGSPTEDLAVYQQQEGLLEVYGLRPTGGYGSLFSVGLPVTNTETPTNALVVPINPDNDTAVLALGKAVPQLVFTEPIVMAAVAAAPCWADKSVGQYLFGCGTQFGTAVSQSVSEEQTVSVSASASVGINVDGGAITQSEFEVKATVEATATAISGRSYDLTKSIVFENASFEDTVVFTTIPYDQYVYEVISHPDPELVGAEVVVSLPRDPITLMAEIGFFNDVVPEDAIHIGPDVFVHTGGDPTTYRSVSEKNGLLADDRMQVGPISVGQGDGNAVELGLDVGTAVSQGTSVGIAFEASVEVTAGTVLAGFSVGTEATDTLVIGVGESTMYSGSAGSLPASTFADNQYAFGVFSYPYTDALSGQQFQVVDYWVE